MNKEGSPSKLKSQCYTQSFTQRNILIAFRVSHKEYDDLVSQAGGKGKLSSFIREKLDLEEKANHG